MHCCRHHWPEGVLWYRQLEEPRHVAPVVPCRPAHQHTPAACRHHLVIQRHRLHLQPSLLLLHRHNMSPPAGITEPVQGGVEAGLRLGLGKAQQDTFYTDADNVVRRKLEVEVQADEDETRAARRQVCRSK